MIFTQKNTNQKQINTDNIYTSLVMNGIFSRLSQFSLIYLTDRFFYRLFAFFRHWFYDGFSAYAVFMIKMLANIDRTFAVRVNFHYLFHPLYQDYTIIGYVLGFIFRSARILIGCFIYILIIIIAAAIYLLWLAVLPYLVWKILF